MSSTLRQENALRYRRMVAWASFGRKAKQAFFILIACGSLVVSSLGSCVCPQHETKNEKRTLSCHSTTHETEGAESDKSKAEVPCVCAGDFSPVILNKSYRKKAEVKDGTAKLVESAIIEAGLYSVSTKPSAEVKKQSVYPALFGRSAPSRAPPRL